METANILPEPAKASLYLAHEGAAEEAREQLLTLAGAVRVAKQATARLLG